MKMKDFKTTQQVLDHLDVEDLKADLKDLKEDISLCQFLLERRDWKIPSDRVEIDEFHQGILESQKKIKTVLRKLQKYGVTNGNCTN